MVSYKLLLLLIFSLKDTFYCIIQIALNTIKHHIKVSAFHFRSTSIMPTNLLQNLCWCDKEMLFDRCGSISNGEERPLKNTLLLGAATTNIYQYLLTIMLCIQFMPTNYFWHLKTKKSIDWRLIIGVMEIWIVGNDLLNYRGHLKV